MITNSIDKQVEQFIRNRKPGTIIFTEDLSGIGSSGAVNIAIHRAEKKGLIRRLARGIYAKPKESNLVGELLPPVEDIAKAIAKRDKAKIIPTGSQALYQLGLSTQLPLKVVYLTDGSPRKLSIGNRTIQFKPTTPKMLLLKGAISRLVVQALKSIGQENVNEEETNKMVELLKKEDRRTLKHDVALAPQWIGEIMAKAL